MKIKIFFLIFIFLLTVSSFNLLPIFKKNFFENNSKKLDISWKQNIDIKKVLQELQKKAKEEHWLFLFIHEVAHLVVAHARNSIKNNDLKISYPYQIKAALALKQTINYKGSIKYQKNFDEKTENSYNSCNIFNKLTPICFNDSEEKLFWYYYWEYLTSIAGNLITNFFYKNKPNSIQFYVNFENGITDSAYSHDNLQADKIQKFLEQYLINSSTKKIDPELIKRNNAEKKVLEIFFLPKNLAITKILVQGLIIKKNLLKDPMTEITWNLVGKEAEQIFSQQQLPENLKTKIPQKEEEEFRMWNKFIHWIDTVKQKKPLLNSKKADGKKQEQTVAFIKRYWWIFLLYGVLAISTIILLLLFIYNKKKQKK